MTGVGEVDKGIRGLGMKETLLSDSLKLGRWFFSQGLSKKFSHINVKSTGIIHC